MGLIVSVYRNTKITQDCTNGGISSRFSALCLVNVSGPFEPSPNAPAALLLPNHGNTARIVPARLVDTLPDGRKVYAPCEGWFMMGGNYASTSDSRLGEAVEALTGANFTGLSRFMTGKNNPASCKG